MYCKKCGTDNPDGAVYCRNCGFELSAARRNNASSAPASHRAAGPDRLDRGAAPAPSYGRDMRASAPRYGAKDAAPADDMNRPLSTWAYYGLSLLYGLSIINIFTILFLVAFYASGGGRAMNSAFSELYGYDSGINAALNSTAGLVVLLWVISILGFVGFVLMILFSCKVVKNWALIKFSRGSLLKWATVVLLYIIATIILVSTASSTLRYW